jgi:hypothetical protein
MVEWGMVQTKDKLAKMVIEEGNGGSHFKHMGADDGPPRRVA